MERKCRFLKGRCMMQVDHIGVFYIIVETIISPLPGINTHYHKVLTIGIMLIKCNDCVFFL